MSRKKTILVLHFSGRMPVAGVGWEGMNWVLGLTKLGHDVWYFEDNRVNPYSFVQNSVHWDSTENIGFVKGMMERYGLGPAGPISIRSPTIRGTASRKRRR